MKNMKKQYVKPELYFENFELSTSIAACAYTDVTLSMVINVHMKQQEERYSQLRRIRVHMSRMKVGFAMIFQLLTRTYSMVLEQ